MLTKATRYGFIGVFLAGIVSVLAGCTAREGALGLVLLLLLQFCTGPMSEETASTGANAAALIVMFSAGVHDGQLDTGGGARLDADALCAAAATSAGIPGASVHALISIDIDDEIQDMTTAGGPITNVPTNRAFVGPPPTNTKIADDWADLISGSLITSLNGAGFGGTDWWSGSTTTGSLALDTCDAGLGPWTDNTSEDGQIGSIISSGSSWLAAGGAHPCNIVRQLVCLGYDP